MEHNVYFFDSGFQGVDHCNTGYSLRGLEKKFDVRDSQLCHLYYFESFRFIITRDHTLSD